MPYVQDGSRFPRFVCEDIERCEFCLAPIGSCVHAYLEGGELAEKRREHEQFMRRLDAPVLRCQCHPDCDRVYR